MQENRDKGGGQLYNNNNNNNNFINKIDWQSDD